MSCTGSTYGEVEFVGYVKGSNETRFALNDSVQGESSNWLKPSQTWRGYTIDSFQSDREVLFVHDANTHFQLKFKSNEGAKSKAPSLEIKLGEKPLDRSAEESARLIQRIERVAASANFNSRDHPEIVTEKLAVEDIEGGSNLHVQYPAPRKIKTTDGTFIVSDVWVQIQETRIYPGPILLIADGKPVEIEMYEGTQILALGLDPALYAHLPKQMQQNLDRSRSSAAP